MSRSLVCVLSCLIALMGAVGCSGGGGDGGGGDGGAGGDAAMCLFAGNPCTSSSQCCGLTSDSTGVCLYGSCDRTQPDCVDSTCAEALYYGDLACPTASGHSYIEALTTCRATSCATECPRSYLWSDWTAPGACRDCLTDKCIDALNACIAN